MWNKKEVGIFTGNNNSLLFSMARAKYFDSTKTNIQNTSKSEFPISNTILNAGNALWRSELLVDKDAVMRRHAKRSTKRDVRLGNAVRQKGRRDKSAWWLLSCHGRDAILAGESRKTKICCCKMSALPTVVELCEIKGHVTHWRVRNLTECLTLAESIQDTHVPTQDWWWNSMTSGMWGNPEDSVSVPRDWETRYLATKANSLAAALLL